MSKYIDIEVPDDFEDSGRTTFEAVDCAMWHHDVRRSAQTESTFLTRRFQ
jgi:hypothetical protein